MRLCSSQTQFLHINGSKNPYVTQMYPNISNDESVKLNWDADPDPASKFPLFEPSHISFNLVMFMHVVFLGGKLLYGTWL